MVRSLHEKNPLFLPLPLIQCCNSHSSYNICGFRFHHVDISHGGVSNKNSWLTTTEQDGCDVCTGDDFHYFTTITLIIFLSSLFSFHAVRWGIGTIKTHGWSLLHCMSLSVWEQKNGRFVVSFTVERGKTLWREFPCRFGFLYQRCQWQG